MMSFPVWLPGPMFFIGVSLPGSMFLQGEGMSLSKGVSVQEVSVQGVSIKGISIKGNLCPGGCLSRSVSVQRALPESRQYASYWNVFLFNNKIA